MKRTEQNLSNIILIGSSAVNKFIKFIFELNEWNKSHITTEEALSLKFYG